MPKFKTVNKRTAQKAKEKTKKANNSLSYELIREKRASLVERHTLGKLFALNAAKVGAAQAVRATHEAINKAEQKALTRKVGNITGLTRSNLSGAMLEAMLHRGLYVVAPDQAEKARQVVAELVAQGYSKTEAELVAFEPNQVQATKHENLFFAYTAAKGWNAEQINAWRETGPKVRDLLKELPVGTVLLFAYKNGPKGTPQYGILYERKPNAVERALAEQAAKASELASKAKAQQAKAQKANSEKQKATATAQAAPVQAVA